MKETSGSSSDADVMQYRCPGCGEIVHATSIRDILEHHQHVLHRSAPRPWFEQEERQRRGVANEPVGATTASRSNIYTIPPDTRLRRYGHG